MLCSPSHPKTHPPPPINSRPPKFSTSLLIHPSHPFSPSPIFDLANQTSPPPPILEETTRSSKCKGLVLSLYEALRSRDVDTVHRLVASDLEWWYHGPPSHQHHLMRLLTGAPDDRNYCHNSFAFTPLSVAAFGSTVLVEGCDPSRSVSWVHAWTVSDEDDELVVVTQVREYFNTSLTVTRLGGNSSSSSAAARSRRSISALRCPPVWESSLANRAGKSVPGLVLAL